eukprot:2995573-Pyramimonas_sp.AAC.1
MTTFAAVHSVRVTRAPFGGERGGELRRRRPPQEAAGLLRSPRAFWGIVFVLREDLEHFSRGW